MAVGYPKDGEVVVTVTPDYHDAFVSIYPAVNGGREVTYQDVMDALAKNAVRYGINEDKIKEAFEKKSFDRQINAAHWTPPINGIDGSIKYYYDQEIELKPKEDENGIVDYKNLGFVRIIEKGNVIAQITHPTNGQEGRDIRGVVIRQTIGMKARYNVGKNTVLSDDGCYITAAESGHLAYDRGTFYIETTLTIRRNIDASTGNIEFIGDIIVSGEVMEGFKVTTNKNITVTENVNGATLEAGGNIVVKKGVISSKLLAHGNITAQFCEYSTITCDGALATNTLVVCNVYCAGSLTASKFINGGKITCLENVTAGSIGTKNYAKTEIVVGDNAVLKEERDGLQKQISEADNQIDSMTKIIDFLNEKKKEIRKLPEDKEEILGKMLKNRIQWQVTKKNLSKRIAEIDETLSVKQFLNVECKGELFPGVKITISDSTLEVKKELRRLKVYLNGSGEITTGPLR